MHWIAGDYVTHKKMKTEWGVGRIVSANTQDLDVFFVQDTHKRTFSQPAEFLERASEDLIDAHPELKNLAAGILNGTAKYLPLSGRIKLFEKLFPFKKHVNEVWSLEHIHAQNAQELTEKKQWKSWLELYLGTLRSLAETDENKAYITEIGEALDNLDSDRFGDRFRDLSARIEAHLSPSGRSGEADHTLANLALLSRDDNSALNNAVFEVKRQMILKMDKDGHYVPLATRNVFLKYYSKAGALQTHFWSPEDKQDYLAEIEKVLHDYLS